MFGTHVTCFIFNTAEGFEEECHKIDKPFVKQLNIVSTKPEIHQHFTSTGDEPNIKHCSLSYAFYFLETVEISNFV